MDQRNLIIGGLILAAIMTIALLSLVMMKPRPQPPIEATGSATKTSSIASTQTHSETATSLPSSGAHRPGTDSHNTTGTQTKTPGTKPLFPTTPTTGTPLPANMVSKDSAAEMAAILAGIREHEAKIEAESLKWAEDYLKNPDLSSNTVETFRFRMIKEYAAGTAALNAKDYSGALREFQKALENPNASPVSKFVIYDYMRHAAVQLKDIDLFIKILGQQARLIAEQDLSVMGIKKSPDSIIVAGDMAKHLRAIRDPQAFNALVDQKLKSPECLTPDDRSVIEAETRKRCKDLERIFQ